MQAKLKLALDFAELYPKSTARVLEELTPKHAVVFIEAMSGTKATQVLGVMLPHYAARCISLLPPEAAARLMVDLDVWGVSNILRYIPKKACDPILQNMKRRFAARVSTNLNYSPSMVGAWIEPAVLSLPLDCTVGAARARIRDDDIEMDYHRAYVIDGAHTLKGYVGLIRLIRAKEKDPVSKLMREVSTVLRATASLELALEDPGWAGADYLPVVDKRNRFLGVARNAAIRAAAATPPPKIDKDHDVSGTFLDLAESCYLGLAGAMSTSLSSRPAKSD